LANAENTPKKVSSLIAQGTEFPLRKPAGFHWDLFLLGLTTGVSGILGLPFPNGLIPQAPFHTESLCVRRAIPDLDESGEHKGNYIITVSHVVEQRFSNLAQGLLTLITMTGPLLSVIHLIPHGVLAGLFFVMGIQALEGNGITTKLVFLAQDKALTPPSHPWRRIRRRAALWYFVAIELIGFGATFAITQTVAAVGFPVFIMLLIPIRALLLPKCFSPEELGLLDEPTASPFTMENVGGTYGGISGEDTAVPSASGSIRNGIFAGSVREASMGGGEETTELGQVSSSGRRRRV
jgi:boron transporter